MRHLPRGRNPHSGGKPQFASEEMMRRLEDTGRGVEVEESTLAKDPSYDADGYRALLSPEGRRA